MEELIRESWQSPRSLSIVRGIEVLERIQIRRMPRRLLKDLARPGEGRYAAEAQAALQRLAR